MEGALLYVSVTHKVRLLQIAQYWRSHLEVFKVAVH